MDFARFDRRGYPTTDVATGYAEWAATYEDVVRDEMDLRLLERIETVAFGRAWRALDLACGTGRIGAWLRARGVAGLDGIDLTGSMLERARARGVYDDLREGDLRSTPFESHAYDLVTASLVDEHLPDPAPMYAEAARLLVPGGAFVVVGYHPQFLMTVGMPTHYHRPDGEAVAIETHVHLLSDHVLGATDHGLALAEMREGLIDDEYVGAKPKWERYRGTPVSFAMVWRSRR
jgi:SAM-dependent methyltransferase